MPFVPTPITRAVDLAPLRTAIRAALLANPAVTAIVAQRVKRDMDVTGNAFPYVAVSIPSSVEMNTQTSTGINALVDVQCIDQGIAANADTVAAAIQTTLLDTAWSVPGYDLVDICREADICRSQIQESKAYYYSGARFRVRLRKQ